MAFWSKQGKLGFPLGQLKKPPLNFTIGAQENLSRDKTTLFVFIFCLFSVLGQASLILVSWDKFPPQIPLFYSRPWGEKMLVSSIGIWILPGLTIFLSFANFLVISYLNENRFLIRTIVVFTFLVAFLTIYDAAKLIALLI